MGRTEVGSGTSQAHYFYRLVHFLFHLLLLGFVVALFLQKAFTSLWWQLHLPLLDLTLFLLLLFGLGLLELLVSQFNR